MKYWNPIFHIRNQSLLLTVFALEILISNSILTFSCHFKTLNTWDCVCFLLGNKCFVSAAKFQDKIKETVFFYSFSCFLFLKKKVWVTKEVWVVIRICYPGIEKFRCQEAGMNPLHSSSWTELEDKVSWQLYFLFLTNFLMPLQRKFFKMTLFTAVYCSV